MKISKLILFILSVGLFPQCKHYEYPESSKNVSSKGIKESKFEDGKCYAKCLITDKKKIESEEYIAYTGNELEEDVDIEIKEIVLEAKSTKWVKKKADRNCLSADPNDCLVWCLVEEPAVTKEIKILLDTTQTNNYQIRKLDYKIKTKKGGYTEWRPALCEKDITNSIITDIQNSLTETGYYEENITGKLDSKTKASLTKFQRDNNLPVGQLDLETLDVLGIVVN